MIPLLDIEDISTKAARLARTEFLCIEKIIACAWDARYLRNTLQELSHEELAYTIALARWGRGDDRCGWSLADLIERALRQHPGNNRFHFEELDGKLAEYLREGLLKLAAKKRVRKPKKAVDSNACANARLG